MICPIFIRAVAFRSSMRSLLVIALLSCAPGLTGQIDVIRYGHAEGLYTAHVTSLAVDDRGVLWVGTDGEGLLYMKSDRLEPAPSTSEIGPVIHELCLGDNGQLVASVADNRVISYNGFEWSATSLVCNPSNDSVNCTARGDLGTVFLGTDSGLFTTDPISSEPKPLRDKAGLLDDIITDLVFDHHNVLWIATANNGLLRTVVNSPEECINIEQIPSLPRMDQSTESLYFIAESPTPALWRYPGSGDSSMTPIEVAASSGIHWYLPIGNERILVNQSDGGLLTIFRDSAIIDDHQGLKLGRVRAGIIDKFNTIWLVSGLGELYKGAAGQQLTRSYCSIPYIWPIAMFPLGDLRLGVLSESAYGIIKDARYERLHAFDEQVVSGTLDAEGMIWAGTKNGQIVKIEPSGNVKAMQIPDRRRALPIVWLSRVGNTLWALDATTLYRCVLDDDGRSIKSMVVVRRFVGEGITSDIVSSTADELVVALPRTICRIPLKGYTTTGMAPLVFVTNISVDGNSIYQEYDGRVKPFFETDKPLALPFGQRDLTMSWDASSASRSSMTYHYRLAPDRPWTPVESARHVQLASLEPGAYRFEIRACDDRRNCGTLDHPFEFVILKPLWYKWWFWAFCAAILVFLGIWVVKSRERRIRETAQRELELANARVEALELEQKALQLQMNPHFIFNALNAVNARMEQGDLRGADEGLKQFSKLMRSMLEMSRKKAVSLEEELAFLESYAQVEKLARGDIFAFNIEIDENVETWDAEIPSMLLQPILENAIQYGGPQIDLYVRSLGRGLELEFHDNGPGLDLSKIDSGKSVALQVLRSRLEHIGGRLVIANDEGAHVSVRLKEC